MNYMDLSKKELIERIKLYLEGNDKLILINKTLEIEKRDLQKKIEEIENQLKNKRSELDELKTRIIRLTDKLLGNVKTILKIINPVLERNLDDDQFIPDNLSSRLIKTMYEDYKKYFLNIHEENI